MNDMAQRVASRFVLPRGFCFPVLCLAVLMATGCQGFFQKQTGNIMGGYAAEHMVPYMMGSGDLAMACETGVSMGAFLMSFERVTDPPNKAALVTLLAAGMCAEADAWEAELTQLRAVRDGQSSDARDARIAEQRLHEVAAQRFYAAYLQADTYFEGLGGTCPELEPDEEILYMLGLSSGMLALVHDRSAGGVAGVPMNIPLTVARGAECLDSDRWWGGPLALKASVWAMVPGASPDGTDPWTTLESAAATGEAAGVRLARAFQVQILDATGHDEELRGAIAAHGESLANTQGDPEWELLDGYATRMILHISDTVWTTERGHRTPFGELGTFYEAPASIQTDGYDDLFEDLLEDTPNTTETDSEENPE